MVAYVGKLSANDWGQTCEWEQWPVGVTAYHLGDGHFAIFELLKMIIEGQELPQLTMDQINAGSKQNAQAHIDCTRADALEKLRHNGAAFESFVAGLSDDDLARQGSIARLRRSCQCRTGGRLCCFPIGTGTLRQHAGCGWTAISTSSSVGFAKSGQRAR